MPRLAWFKTLAIGFIVLLGAALQGCTQNKEPLSFAGHVWPGYEFIFLADNLGLLDAEQVRLEKTNSATDSLNLLIEGRVDAAALTLDEVIKARSQGAPLSVIAVFDISAGADMVICRNKIDDLSHLKGMRLGVETSALGALVLSQLLEKAGLSQDDLTIVRLTIDEQEQAWNDDLIDAVITYEPVAGKLIKDGGHKVFDSRDMPEMILDVLAVREEALKKETQILHLLKANFDALQHFEAQRQDALYRIAPRLGVAPDEVPAQYEGLLLPNLVNNQRLLRGDNSKIHRASEKIANIMTKEGLLASPVSLERFVNARFVEKL